MPPISPAALFSLCSRPWLPVIGARKSGLPPAFCTGHSLACCAENELWASPPLPAPNGACVLYRLGRPPGLGVLEPNRSTCETGGGQIGSIWAVLGQTWQHPASTSSEITGLSTTLNSLTAWNAAGKGFQQGQGCGMAAALEVFKSSSGRAPPLRKLAPQALEGVGVGVSVALLWNWPAAPLPAQGC